MSVESLKVNNNMEEIDQEDDVSGEEDRTHEGDVATPAGAKKRWRRNLVACDACHTRRVRCDRAFPCSRCVGSQIRCELTRERRKRGRIPRNDSLRASGSFVRHSPSKTKASEQKESVSSHQQDFISMVTNPPLSEQLPPTVNVPCSASGSPSRLLARSSPNGGEREPRTDNNIRQLSREVPGGANEVVEDWMSGLNGFLQATQSDKMFGSMGLGDGLLDLPFEISGMGDVNGFQLSRSASRQRMSNAQNSRVSEAPLKYPVLAPLMPFIESYISRNMIYDLLNLYFTSAFSTMMHPLCHHIHCYVVRKQSFLSREIPRHSSPALLASMLWVGALDDRSFALSISHPKRKKLCQFLCALTIRLLRPLIHVSFKDDDAIPVIEDDHGFPHAGYDKTHSLGEGGDDRGLVGPAGSLDDVITYMHVASIVSASEQKAASMRWYVFIFCL
jgi:hypothetical protein